MKGKKAVKSKPIAPLVKEIPIPAPPFDRKQLEDLSCHQKDVSCGVDMISISDEMLTILSPVESQKNNDRLIIKEGKVKPK